MINNGGIFIKTIAVCLPSYNEAENIGFITKKVDDALMKLNNKYRCVLINCDNNSDDKTNQIFESCSTVNKKISIVTDEIGKGVNIINFLNYCKKNNVDYGFVFDSDLKSFKLDWIKKMLDELEKGNNFILPLYKRQRCEGNTTNHFVLPLLYILYGNIIRQPIGGDYGFDIKYIEVFNEKELPNEIRKYGIDIYMLLLAINENMNLKQVELGTKSHNPSYKKMQKIFIDVARGVRCSLVKFGIKSDCNMFKEDKNFISILKSKKFKYYDEAVELYKELVPKIESENISILWKKEIINYLINIDNITDEDIYNMSFIFLEYVFTYWEKFKDKSAETCEKAIIDFSKEIHCDYLKVKEEVILNANN